MPRPRYMNKRWAGLPMEETDYRLDFQCGCIKWDIDEIKQMYVRGMNYVSIAREMKARGTGIEYATVSRLAHKFNWKADRDAFNVMREQERIQAEYEARKQQVDLTAPKQPKRTLPTKTVVIDGARLTEMDEKLLVIFDDMMVEFDKRSSAIRKLPLDEWLPAVKLWNQLRRELMATRKRIEDWMNPRGSKLANANPQVKVLDEEPDPEFEARQIERLQRLQEAPRPTVAAVPGAPDGRMVRVG